MPGGGLVGGNQPFLLHATSASRLLFVGLVFHKRILCRQDVAETCWKLESSGQPDVDRVSSLRRGSQAAP